MGVDSRGRSYKAVSIPGTGMPHFEHAGIEDA
jgi:hypothetical protein